MKDSDTSRLETAFGWMIAAVGLIVAAAIVGFFFGGSK